MKTGKNIIASMLLFIVNSVPIAHALAINCHDEKLIDFSQVVSCYREKLATAPLVYNLLAKTLQYQVTVQNYQMASQSWPPGGEVKPALWQHQVDIYLPEHPVSRHALVVINNGINYAGTHHPAEESKASSSVPELNKRLPDEFDAASLAAIARATQTIVISVSNVPNQYLNYKGEAKSLREDDSVARSWMLFLDNPSPQSLMPLHIPMAAAVSQAMRLAKQELMPWKIDKFIVTGASKRGWATWLSLIADPDVDAIVPFVIDLLDTRVALNHMYRSYGGNWPIAFYPYYRQGIDNHINTPAFADLMKIEDPLQYLTAGNQARLGKSKYIINASGDDFYAPDNARFYYDALPGEKSLRVVPNSDHGGILKYTERSLVAFLQRFHRQIALPQVNTELVDTTLTVTFSEKPVKITRWTANNPTARDFRYACGIRYSASPVKVPTQGAMTLELQQRQPGWQATFIEATFDDGFVATSRVFITPDEVYPNEAPPAKDGACSTLPGRGLGDVAPQAHQLP